MAMAAMATVTAAVAAMATAMVAMATATVAVAVATMATSMAWMATATAAVATMTTAMVAVTTINSKKAATVAAEELDNGRDGRRLCSVFFCYSYFFSPSSPPTLNAKATERSLPQGASRACCLCFYPQFAIVVGSIVFVFFRCLHRRRCCVRCHHRCRRCHFLRWIF